MNKDKILFQLYHRYKSMMKHELINELLYLQEVYLIGGEE
jgi:hypothetical protein